MEVELSLAWFQRLASLPGAYWLRDGDTVFCGALPKGESSDLDPEPTLSLSAYASDEGSAWPRWVGVLPYEAFRGLETQRREVRAAPLFEPIEWRRYAATVRIRGGKARIFGETEDDCRRLERAVEAASPSSTGLSLLPSGEPEADSVHEERIRRALLRIERGALYQVNLARRLDFRAHGRALEFLFALGGDESLADWLSVGGARCAFAQELGARSVVSLSPELFVRVLSGGQVQTTPIKGTRPRDMDPERDRANLLALNQSEKEQAELTMVIDLERNDLGKVSRPGSVVLLDGPRVVSHGTVHHREATVAGILRPGVGRAALLRALMPSGSVTGAPKRAAMDAIAEFEAARRGLYTGAHGYLAQDGTLHLSMAIRCLALAGGHAHYFSGGGIVADSDPRAEVEETRWKAEQLRRLVSSRFC